eukprot:6718273-Alexandrium_andersonii.AAC.1
MSASLVGSEMCIRDRDPPLRTLRCRPMYFQPPTRLQGGSRILARARLTGGAAAPPDRPDWRLRR